MSKKCPAVGHVGLDMVVCDRPLGHDGPHFSIRRAQEFKTYEERTSSPTD